MQSVERMVAKLGNSDAARALGGLPPVAPQAQGPQMQNGGNNLPVDASSLLKGNKFASSVTTSKTSLRPVTGAEVWQALQADPQFQKQIGTDPDGIAFYKAVAEKSPEFLKDLLEEKAGLKNILLAKVATFRYIVESNLLDKFPSEIVDKIKGFFNSLIQQLEHIIANLDEFIRQSGKTERELLAQVFTPENLASFDKGELTVCKLLLSQPWFVLGDRVGN